MLPHQKHWDLTHLAAKYPWLRVDSTTIEEFRSPFVWVREGEEEERLTGAKATSKDDADDDDDDDENRTNSPSQSDASYFSLSSRKCKSMRNKWSEKNQQQHGKYDVSRKRKKTCKLPPSKEISKRNVHTPLALPHQEQETLYRMPSIAQHVATNANLSTRETTNEEHIFVVKKKKKKKAKNAETKKKHNILSLSFPVLAKKITPNGPLSTIQSSEVLTQQYAKELQRLKQAEQELKLQVQQQIESEKAKLPLTFLFEHNLESRTYCKQKSIATITHIFSKFQNRLVFQAFDRWCQLVHELQTLERKEIACKRLQLQALHFFQRVANDAYVGSIGRAFHRWLKISKQLVFQEQWRAATMIQSLYRKRRAKHLLNGLKQAALDREYKHKIEIQQLLRFESYGTAMQWSTLRIGFDLLLQNHCARRIQFFFRRLVVCRKVEQRVVRKQAATRIQSYYRRVLAKRELSRRKVAFAARRAIENRAAIEVQRHIRGFLSKCEAQRRREWLSHDNQCAIRIQRWWQKCCEKKELNRRFEQRRQILYQERVRIAAAEYVKAQIRLEGTRQRCAGEIQRVFRGFLGRKIYNQALYVKRLELAARRVQSSWRRSTGRYALHLRFAAQRQRLEERKQEAILQIQCWYRMQKAIQIRKQLHSEKQQRHHAAVHIQRMVRGRQVNQKYQQTRRATIKIQNGIKCKLARLERQRRFDARENQRRARLEAAIRLQNWMRMLAAKQKLQVLRVEKAEEEQRKAHLALLLQKRARGIEVRKTIQILRLAMQTIELEQRRRFPSSTNQNMSQILEFIATYYANNPTFGSESEADGTSTSVQLFSSTQYEWLTTKINEVTTQIAREDRAVVFLQHHYRGYACRVAFWVRKAEAKKRRALENKMAIRIQCIARGYLAGKRAKAIRQKQKLEDLKQAYIRERRWKEQEQQWKEQYHREQMEIQIRNLQTMELKVREVKREAELAKWQADMAKYRKEIEQQYQQQQQQPIQREAIAGDIIDPNWEQLLDAYGNVYYYNTQTGESRWDMPAWEPKPIEPVVIAENLPSIDAPLSSKDMSALSTANQEDPVSSTSSSELDVVASKVSIQDEKEPAVTPDVAEKADTEQDRMCWNCKISIAVKECMDCLNPKQTKYCASCFTLEHHGANSPKQNHDFRVLIAVKCQSRCQAGTCQSKTSTDSVESNLATYFCYNCVPNSSDPSSTQCSLRPDQNGRFYCEECFCKAHQTAQELHHVANALHFKTGAQLCCDCQCVIATRFCEQCEEEFCATCFDRIHSHSQKKKEHEWTPLEVIKEDLTSNNDAYCVECDIRRCTKLCNLCGDGFCDACFAKTHDKGNKKHHTWVSWAKFTQVGDWLEIWDEKANATIFFNIETKESTTKQPFVLKSGAERHQLQLQEREQQYKRKELELESEVVKLKEQLKELQEKQDILQARPLSRNVRSVNEPRSTAPGSGDQDNVKKKNKNGLFRGIFSRSNKKNASSTSTTDGLTPEERKRQALITGIRDDELNLALQKLTTRNREEKEAKARETFGTKNFEAAMIHDLTQIN